MMGLGSPLHLPFWGSAIVFLIILVTVVNYFFFFNYMSSCKFYHDFILAPIKCQKKVSLNTAFHAILQVHKVSNKSF